MQRKCRTLYVGLIVPKEMNTVRLRRIRQEYHNELYEPLAAYSLPNINTKSAHAHLLCSRHALWENGCHRHVISSTCCHWISCESSTSDYVVCMEMSAWVPAVSEGRLRTAATERNKQKVDGLIRQDRRITFREIAAQLGGGHHAVQEMMEILGCGKVCSCWVPRLLTEEHKTVRTDVSSQLLRRYAVGSDDFLFNIVTGDESWFHHFDPETKRRQFRKPCEAGCEELERTSTAEAS
jgi:hypothetical protein